MADDTQGVIVVVPPTGRLELRHLECVEPDETIWDSHPGPMVYYFCEHCWVLVEGVVTMDEYLDRIEVTYV